MAHISIENLKEQILHKLNRRNTSVVLCTILAIATVVGIYVAHYIQSDLYMAFAVLLIPSQFFGITSYICWLDKNSRGEQLFKTLESICIVLWVIVSLIIGMQ